VCVCVRVRVLPFVLNDHLDFESPRPRLSSLVSNASYPLDVYPAHEASAVQQSPVVKVIGSAAACSWAGNRKNVDVSGRAIFEKQHSHGLTVSHALCHFGILVAGL
jgi:hypothetical protein